jgi:hypothetical protein
MTNSNVDFQLAPPGIHQRNAAERAIRTFKNHSIAGLCSVDQHFPLHFWDRLLPQAILTLNLLRGSRINPKLSAWAQLNGAFDYNCTPIAPPGTRVLIHEKPDKRESWSPHALDGWYVGPALDSDRCYNVWMWDTRRERIADTLSWFPTKITLPLATSNNLILAGIADILQALRRPTPPNSLLLLTPQHHVALCQLTTILTGLASKPQPPPTPTAAAPLRVGNAGAPLRVPLTPTLPIIALPAARPAPQQQPTAPTLIPTDDAPSPLTQPTPKPTTIYHNSTGTKGRRHRRQACKQASANATPVVTKLAPAFSACTAKAAIAVAKGLSPSHHYALHGNASNPNTSQIFEYLELSKCSEGHIWHESNAEEIGRLAQGYKDIVGTNTIFFIRRRDIPKGRKSNYLHIVAAYHPKKDNPHHIRWTAGVCDCVDYPGDTSTKTADLTTVKCNVNSVVSTKDARYMTGNLKDFYLGTPIDHYEYM